MRMLFLIFLYTTSLFSQKLWEIEIDPSDYLRDVVEIPNSDLLLFTYNTGKLEIRNSQDGSFVNKLIKKPNESGELRISSNGQFYHYKHHNDSIEFRDIMTNEAIIRISPEIEELKGNPIFDRKYFSSIEIFDNNSKIVGSISYIDNEDSRNSTYRFVIYNLLTKEIEYKSTPYKDYYEGIKKTYKSPDDKYFIEFALYHPRARMFNLETREYEFEFDGENNVEQRTKVGILENGKFQNDNLITDSYADIFVLYSFPTLTLIDKIDVWSKAGFLIGAMVEMNVCDNIFITDVSIRKENSTTQYNYYFVKYNFKNNEILYSSFNEQDSYQYRPVFSFDNCEKVLVNRDINNIRNGIIACYDSSVLNIKDEIEHNIFPNPTSDIINIDTKEATNIELFDIFGNRLIEDFNRKLDISNLSPGTYYIRFLGQTKMVVKI